MSAKDFLYVLEGQIDLHTELMSRHRLSPGDFAYFDSTMATPSSPQATLRLDC